AVEPMFSAMCDCQALHPDPEDADTDDDDYEGEEYDVEEAEQEQGQGQGQGDVPTFYTYEEGLSHLTAEGQATLDRLEGMLAQSVTQQHHMAGVRSDEPSAEFEGRCVFKLIIETVYFSSGDLSVLERAV
ncbi:methylosome subunit pICln-like, partial [Sinocyclocheilus grahami]|uniref:methylosome subunit pICln-like n=1 Tax=Sinocyclocheilus grahami TaxID=75366 RepID=UPI0007AD68B1